VIVIAAIWFVTPTTPSVSDITRVMCTSSPSKSDTNA